MGLFDSIKDKLSGNKDDAAQPAPEVSPDDQARIDQQQASNEATAAAAQAELDAQQKAEDEARAKAEADQKAKQEAAAKAEAEQKAKEKAEQEAAAKREADQKAKQEAAAKAEAEQKAKEKAEQEAAAKREADQKAKQEAASKQRTYTVKPGDNLSEIGAKFGVNYMDIARANNIENPDLIYPGQVFVIPE
ncbi:LysM peptidoglycan-binding domain-containing protein [Luteococcus sp. OSA5]|uniref:LysM peptidoglycan-binding domain-containing protein n=1 Tax=Luteococcus sp. OSA5 TaxID=3401630 RepID=UPI003B43A550